MHPRLVWPEERYFAGYLSAAHEMLSGQALMATLNEFPNNITINRDREQNTPGQPVRTYWLVHDDEYIGMVQIRLEPRARFPNIASHIYYEVRPSKRGRGYGHAAMRLLVEEAKAAGLRELILSCDSSNQPSRHIIESAGAVLMGTERVPDREREVLMYRLPLGQSLR